METINTVIKHLDSFLLPLKLIYGLFPSCLIIYNILDFLEGSTIGWYEYIFKDFIKYRRIVTPFTIQHFMLILRKRSFLKQFCPLFDLLLFFNINIMWKTQKD